MTPFPQDWTTEQEAARRRAHATATCVILEVPEGTGQRPFDPAQRG